ncbi:MAG: hypothetical protein WC010_02970 [Candidatus Absconditabacterales bacterium]
MKKFIIPFVIALSYFAIPTSAQIVQKQVKKNGSLETYTYDRVLLGVYNDEQILQAYMQDSLQVGSKVSYEYSLWGIKKQITTTSIFLVREWGLVKLKTKPPVVSAWKIASETILFWLLSFIPVFLLKSFKKKIRTILICVVLGALVCILIYTLVPIMTYNTFLGIGIGTMVGIWLGSLIGIKTDVGTSIIAGSLIGAAIGWFLYIGLMKDQWLSLIVTIILFVLGTIIRQLFEKSEFEDYK